MTTPRLGDLAPDFQVNSSEGVIRFHDWSADHWVLLLSHPHQFRPVCATEYAALARLAPAFGQRRVKVLMVGIDPVDTFGRWADDIRETQGVAINFPVVFDADGQVTQRYGLLHEAMSESAPMRCTFVIDPARRIRAMSAAPASLGRNFDELLRTCDALQLTDRAHVATPAGWQPGADVLIVPGMPADEADRRFPGAWTELRPYLRVVRGASLPDAATEI